MAISPTPAAAIVPTRKGPSQPDGRLPNDVLRALVEDCAKTTGIRRKNERRAALSAIEPEEAPGGDRDA